MEGISKEILSEIYAIRWVAGPVLVVAFVIYLANLTEALEKLHGFWKRARGEKKQSPDRDSELAEEFEELRGNINYCGPVNNLPIVLHALRQFLIKHGYIDSIEFRSFADKWLSRYPVIKGIEAVNVFTSEDIDLMLNELKALRLQRY